MIFVEVLRGEEWFEIPFEDIKKGDRFRYLYEPEEYIAGSNAFWDEKENDYVVALKIIK